MKTVEEIYREMMDRFSQETGMEPNGTGEMAVRMYALAAQVYGLYEELAWTCRQCFPQTATGEELEKHGFLRGIARNPARQASGTLRFSVQEAVEEDLEIAQGTVCMTAGLVAFETTQAGVLPAGELSVDLPAQAVEPGPGAMCPPGRYAPWRWRRWGWPPVPIRSRLQGGGRKKGTRNCGPGFWPLTSSYPTAPMEPTMPRRPWRWRG